MNDSWRTLSIKKIVLGNKVFFGSNFKFYYNNKNNEMLRLHVGPLRVFLQIENIANNWQIFLIFHLIIWSVIFAESAKAQ